MSVHRPSPDALWRCAVCGKWSHAQRKPKDHQRWIDREDGLPNGAEVVSEVEPYGYGHHSEEANEGGWFVKCGPFDTWIVRRVG